MAETINENVTPEFWPKMNLFPRLQRVGSAVVHFFTDRHTIPYSEAVPQRGGGAMLDSELYDQVQVEGFRYEGEQLEFGYDADGEFVSREPGKIGGVLAQPTATLETPVPFSRYR